MVRLKSTNRKPVITIKMELFDTEKSTNLLPFDGVVNYYGKVFNKTASQHYFDKLLSSIEWKNDEVIIFGKHLITKRKTAWYAGSDYVYAYSGTTKKALAWTKELLELKEIAERITGTSFNSCLLNLYHNGDEGMGWHSDDEKSLVGNSAIASFSFGAERKFALKHKKIKQQVSLSLENGSLLVMKNITQTHWLHCLPKSRKVSNPRINLTFRTMVD